MGEQVKELIAVVDIETTGLKVEVHKICQLTILIAESTWTKDGFDYKITNKFTSLVRQPHEDFIDKNALKVNRLNWEQLKKAPQPSEVLYDLLNWWDEFVGEPLVPLGHNYSFDHKFLSMFFGELYRGVFKYHNLDTYTLAKTLGMMGKLDQFDDELFNPTDETSYRLSSLSGTFGIPHLSHTSEGDAKATIELYKRLCDLI